MELAIIGGIGALTVITALYVGFKRPMSDKRFEWPFIAVIWAGFLLAILVGYLLDR